MGSGSTLCRGVGARFSLASLLATALVCGASFPACLPDAEKDYNEFRAETEAIRGKKVIDFGGGGGGSAGAGGEAGAAGAPAVGLPDATGTYHVTCLPSIGGGDPAKALRFVATIAVTKDTPEAETGTAVFTLTPLLIPATSISQTTGASFTTAAPVAFTVGQPSTLDFGDGVSVPGEANPISMSEILLNSAQMVTRIKTPTYTCAELNGQAVKPLQIDLAAATSIDVCLFDRIPDGTDAVARVTDANRFVPCE